MTSGLYRAGVSAIMSGNIDLLNDSISAMLVDTTVYTVDLTSDSTQDDIPSAAQIAEVTLTGKTLDGTTFRASDATFTGVDSGETIGAVIIFLDTDYDSTSLLLAYIDNADEFPLTTDGTAITVAFDTGDNGVFKL